MHAKHSSTIPLLLVSVLILTLHLFVNCISNETNHVEEINAPCDCGKYGINCVYKDGVKFCLCEKGFKQNGELCERCDCRRHTKDCNFVDGKMICSCNVGYIQKDDICVDACSKSKPCLNGGTCSNGVCSCRNGVAGNLCQIIPACEYDQQCGLDQDTKCVYDIQEEKAVCKCRMENQVFVDDEKKCRVECKNTNDCQNGGECIKKMEGFFCQCKAGTAGDFCGNAVCDEPCFVGAHCKYDSKLEKSYCECEKKDEMPDPEKKICRKQCKVNSECKYGAKCSGLNKTKFCDCKDGTKGSFCEVCDMCGEGGDASCVLKVDGSINCVCKDKGVEFDRVTKSCKKPCESGKDCLHLARCEENDRYSDNPIVVQPTDKKYCRCLTGTSGDRCEIVDDCLPEKKHCGDGDDVECLYDDSYLQVYCKCLDGEKAFDEVHKVCKDCNCGPYAKSCSSTSRGISCKCDEGYFQRNDTCEECHCGPTSYMCIDVIGRKICVCDPGYQHNGSACEKCDCGPHSDKCEFGEGGEKTCNCHDFYEQVDGQCVRTCDGIFTECMNGGVCDKDTHSCECKKGTNGTLCEVVLDCDQYNICGGSTDATCTYDEQLEVAYCKCKNDLHEFDEQDRKCKECYCGKHGSCSFVNNERTCKCGRNYAIKNGICAECDCGKFGSCYFDGNEKKCNCTDGYGFKNGLCVACPCQDNSNGCFYQGNELTCQCKKGFAQKGNKCVECDCGKHGTCSFEGSGKKVCHCDDGYFLNKGSCQRECEDDCLSGGTCQDVSGKKFCACLHGTHGERCEIIDDCLSIFQQCREENGICKFKVTERQAYCDCKAGTRYDENSKMCRRLCSKDAQCRNGGICRNQECQCPKGTSGDYCSTVDGCKVLEETCKKGGAACNFDSEKDQKAACVCENQDLVFDEDINTCVAKWCQVKRCDDRSTCEFDVESRTGYCKCQNPHRYYDYTERTCKPIDPCQLKTCAENEVCIKGECKCADGYEESFDHDCKANFCKQKRCFTLGSCQETDIPGLVNCHCNAPSFFDGSECQWGPCIIPKYRQQCRDSYGARRCPLDMVWNANGYCEPKDEERKCEKDCMHGWCIKEGNEEVCKCIKDHALLRNGTCILNANICASKKLTPDLYKCDCSGIFKYADDDFTCERRSCNDADVQEECLRRGATSCRDNWRLIGRDIGFECLCSPGFEKDKNGLCRETCELETHVAECSKTNSICYLNEHFEPNCSCPPTFSWNNEKQECEYHGENAFLLKNIPVRKQRYVQKDGSVDRMLLHADVIRSINTMYTEEVLDFAKLSNFKTIGNVLFCDVVLQFKKTTQLNTRRFGLQVMKNISCADCEEDVAMLPPSLMLQNNVENVSIESVDFCSESVKNLLCGKEADCKDRKCFCPLGYTMMEGTLKETDNYTTLKCEDIDECQQGLHFCTENTTCVNTPGNYYCQCLPGFKKIGELLPFQNEINKNSCVDICSSNPCNRGQCSVRDKILHCRCDVGFAGFLCDVEDVYLKKARKVTNIISGVLGGLLFVTIVLFVIYVVRRRNTKSDSDDTHVSQVCTSELHERRPPNTQNNHRK